MSEDTEHPALKNFNGTIETVKETGKGALGGAVKGGLIGGAVAGGLAMLAPAALMLIPGVGWALGGALAVGGSAVGLGTGLVSSAAIGGAVFGAKAGGIIGGARGLMGAGEEIEKKKQNLIDNFERNEMRQERREAMAMRQQATRMQLARQGAAMGVSPDSLPRGAEAGVSMGRA